MSDTDSELKRRISISENRSHVCGFAVFFGLFIEVFLAGFYRDHTSQIENWAPVFADMLIALGVLGEIIFSGRASQTEKILRLKSEEKVSEANARTATAEVEIERLRDSARRYEIDS